MTVWVVTTYHRGSSQVHSVHATEESARTVGVPAAYDHMRRCYYPSAADLPLVFPAKQAGYVKGMACDVYWHEYEVLS